MNIEETETSNDFIQTVSHVVSGYWNSVAALDLRLTITNIESTIKKVYAGDFPQSWDDSEDSVTIAFGNLHHREKFSVSVDLLLDEVSKSRVIDAVEFIYYYKDWYVTNFFPYPFLFFVKFYICSRYETLADLRVVRL